MNTIQNRTGLTQALLILEERTAGQGRSLKHKVEIAFDSMKPVNIVKDTFNEILVPGIKNNLLNLTLGAGVGFFVRSWRLGAAQSRLKSLLINAIGLGVTQIIRVKSAQFSRREMATRHPV